MNKTFGKQKLIRDISANTLQAGIVQFFGLIIFYITSKYLSKNDFGEFNWSMAVGSTLIAIASLGLDLVFVKRIASGENVVVISGIHLFHTVLAGISICALAFGIKILFPAFNESHPLFFIVFINLAIANVANSFKLCLNGLESYRLLAILALCTNVFKFGLIVYIFVSGHFTITNVVFAYILGSVVEFILGYLFTNKSISERVKPLLKVEEYRYFILESLPQLGVVLFDSALARVDWILLGIISSAAAIADYSFTYKIYELSKLPLLIVAPVLLTRFSKMFTDPSRIDDRNRQEIQLFFKLELFLVMFIPLILICVWSPLMDYFTDNKYGSVNEVNFWLLAPCVPIMCMINFLWTLGFVQGQLKAILFITIAASILNILANIILIPRYGGTGSAVGFLICTIIQLGLYLRYIDQDKFRLHLLNCFVAFINTFAAIIMAKLLTNNIIFTSITAVGFYVALSFVTRQVNIKQIKQVMQR